MLYWFYEKNIDIIFYNTTVIKKISKKENFSLEKKENSMSTNLNIRIDKKIKDQAEIIFAELGLNMTTAINMFLRTVVREKKIPFELKLEKPNEITAAAIKEGRKIAYDDSIKGHSNIDDLMKALEEWNTK